MLTVAAILLIFIGVPVVILLVRDRVACARRESPDARVKADAERRERERRLLAPDWISVELDLQRPAPRALRDLYANRALVTRQDLPCTADCTISAFEPLDERAMAHFRKWLGFPAVVFATTQEGDAIWLRCGQEEADAVYLTHHDGGDTEMLAARIDGMLDTLRAAVRRA